MNSELFAREVELLLREAVESCENWIEDDYGRAIMNCCGAEVSNPNLTGFQHEPDCWLVKAQKLLGTGKDANTVTQEGHWSQSV